MVHYKFICGFPVMILTSNGLDWYLFKDVCELLNLDLAIRSQLKPPCAIRSFEIDDCEWFINRESVAWLSWRADKDYLHRGSSLLFTTKGKC